MKYLIDGYNLIHRTGIIDRCANDINLSREKLEASLGAYLASRRGIKAVIVYDSRHNTSAVRSPGTGRLSIIFSAGDADAKIGALIRNEKKIRELVVVSTDKRHVISSAKSYGADYMLAERFWKMITKRNPGRAPGERAGKHQSPETTDWYEKILRKKGKLR